MKKLYRAILFSFLMLFFITSCKKYVDVIPDNVATIDNAFALRSQAEKYLFTCYSYLPRDADVASNPALGGSGEIVVNRDPLRFPAYGPMFQLIMGNQNFVNPIANGYWSSMYLALRDCNIFLENIPRVPDMRSYEKANWVAEVKFLKAYYHFYLMRMYGPIPLIKTNLPVYATIDQVKVKRDPVDSCFQYIVQLLDEAKDSLPDAITQTNMIGRISKPIALALKAKVLVMAASPLFNGNTDQASLKNADGTQLFNQTYDPEKWKLAALACKAAIDTCHNLGYRLHIVPSNMKGFNLTDKMRTQLNIRNSLTDKDSPETIWFNTQSWGGYLAHVASPKWDPTFSDNIVHIEAIDAPLKIAESYYTKNGLPIDEDKTWNYDQRYALRTGTAAENLYIRQNYTTANLNFDREPRFYAHLGFDGGVWYGQGRFNDKAPLDLFFLTGKKGQVNGKPSPQFGPISGYVIKKYVHFENTHGSVRIVSTVEWPWPLFRLADLYLLYAEALNETNSTPANDVYEYINLVRTRAGIPEVQTAWTNFGKNATKHTTREGMRSIIHRERQNELAFEANYFWDIRRWKAGIEKLNVSLLGWNLEQQTAEGYYIPVKLYDQRFSTKDYFWPISEGELTRNTNLIQNTGW